MSEENTNSYIKPSFDYKEKYSTVFTCPFCNAITQQYWRHNLSDYNQGTINEISEAMCKEMYDVSGSKATDIARAAINQYARRLWKDRIRNLVLARCCICARDSIWVDREMIHPRTKTGPELNPSVPDNIKKTYEQARTIASDSPSAAAALLRLATHKLCTTLGGNDKNLNKAIASLVEKGLPKAFVESLDILRVVGNDAVHAGEINLNDDKEIINDLFTVINGIIDYMITRPKTQADLLNKLPKAEQDKIKNRDKQAPKEGKEKEEQKVDG